MASTTIEVRISASASAGGIEGDIANTSAGATAQYVSVGGAVDPDGPTLTASTVSIDLGTATSIAAGTAETFTVGGSSLTDLIAVSGPAGVELSDDGGTTWSQSLDLSESGGTVPSTTIVVRLDPSANIGPFSGILAIFSTGAVEQNIEVTGTIVQAASITTSEGFLQLGTSTFGAAGTAESFTVGGSTLTGDVDVAAPAGVELSDDGGTTWGSGLDLPESDGGIASTTVDVRIAASAAIGPSTGLITITSTGALEQYVNIIGSVAESSVAASTSQTFYGQSVTLTATFQAAAMGDLPMSGTVSFYDGGTLLGTAALVSSSPADGTAAAPLGEPPGLIRATASLTTSSLYVGMHDITAVYAGGGPYGTLTTSTSVAVRVVPDQTSTALAASITAQGTILRATVVSTAPGTPDVAGTVSFYDRGELLGTATLEDGVAVLNAGALAPGDYTFSAEFSGGGNASTSGTTLAVSTASPTVTRMQRFGFHHQPTFLVLSFSAPLDPAAAEDVANCSLVGPIGQGRVHPYAVGIDAAVYDAASNTVTLVLDGRWNVHWRWRRTYDDASDGDGSKILTMKDLAGRAGKLPTASVVAGTVTAGARARHGGRPRIGHAASHIAVAHPSKPDSILALARRATH